MKPLLILALATTLLAAPRDLLAAQPEGTPVDPYANGCTVEPMPQATIDALAAEADAATPAAPANTTITDLPEGAPISDAQEMAIQELIGQLEACSAAQDLPRWISLFSERYIVESILADEPVKIIPATPRPQSDATPAVPPTDQERMVLEAVMLPDGRIVALVSRNAWGGNPQVFWFVEQGGSLVIDDIAEYAGDSSNAGGTVGVEIPAGAQSVVDLVLQDAATQLGIAPDMLQISEIEAVDWPDSSLGCPEDGFVYMPVISPGYQIIVTDGESTLVYHTGPDDAIVSCPA